MLSAKDELVRKGTIAGDKAYTGPYGLQVGITDYCNYSCVFCGSFSYRNDPPRGRQKDFIKIEYPRFAKLVEDAKEMGVEQISIVGVGEPFLHPDIMRFIRLVKDSSIRCMVTTNGATLDRHKMDDLIDNRLDIINVSLNAATGETYAIIHGKKLGRRLELILENISYLSARKRDLGTSAPHLALRFVMTRLNAGEIEAFVDKAILVGADELVFQHYVPPPFAEDIVLESDDKKKVIEALGKVSEKIVSLGIRSNIDFVAARYKGESKALLADNINISIDNYYHTYPCYTGWTYVMVLATGDVMPCCYCETPLGNINENSFKDIWHGDKYNAFRLSAINLPKSKLNIERCACFDNCGSVAENIRLMQQFGSI